MRNSSSPLLYQRELRSKEDQWTCSNFPSLSKSVHVDRLRSFHKPQSLGTIVIFLKGWISPEVRACLVQPLGRALHFLRREETDSSCYTLLHSQCPTLWHHGCIAHFWKESPIKDPPSIIKWTHPLSQRSQSLIPKQSKKSMVSWTLGQIPEPRTRSLEPLKLFQ